MEPRVSNLLLVEQSPTDRHEIDIHAVPGNPSGAEYPSTTLPAIRPLHEHQLFDARPYTNEIDSLTLPEIDWDALTASLHPHPPAANTSTPQNVAAPTEQATTQAKKPTKSGAPIAEVLNQVSPEIRNAQREDLVGPEAARKRRRLDAAPVTRTLPRPALAATKKASKRQLLPPLLVPLHEPPPNAGLIPSMATEVFEASMDKVPSREMLRTENGQVTPTKLAVTEQDKAHAPKNAKASPAIKSRRVRHNWSKEETSDLLRGVAIFGIGNWKKILVCPEYKFRNRTAVDLKDRFRTCCPEEYRKVGTVEKVQNEGESRTVDSDRISEKTKTKEKPAKLQESSEKSQKFENKLPDELARLGISGPFPKVQRRARRGFTAEEDEAILRGFEQYGAKWTKIQSDPDLDLSSRSRTDLRDRFRNKFPDKFIETGHKFKQKDGEALHGAKEAETKDGQSTGEQALSSSAPQSVAQQQLPATAIHDVTPALHSLRLLPTSIMEPNYFPDFGDLTPGTDEQVTLSRNIFDWADQNNRMTTTNSATRAETTVNTFEFGSTITTMDQFHMNPMLALKAPHQAQPSASASVREGATTAAPSNLFPQLPLSGILNGPVSLPSTAELVSGLDGEGNV
jgi:hypothetical protein